MKKHIFIFLISINSFAQSFTAETGMIFTDDAANGNYAGSIKVLSGTLKKGDEIDVYAPSGRKYTFLIKKLKVNDVETSQAKAGSDAFADLYSKERADQGKDGINEGFKVYPKGFVIATTEKAVSPTPISKKGVFSVIANGKTLNYSLGNRGALFYPNGIKQLDEKPFIQLAFVPNHPTDNRQLTIKILSPKAGKASYSGANQMEVLVTGAESGKSTDSRMYGRSSKSNPNIPFTIEINEWKESAGAIFISGKINGTLMETLTVAKKQSIEYKEGSFSNLKMEIIK
jgi:hypothetical protein